MTARISRLEKLLYRMEAQVACLNWAFGDVAARPGIVFEMGLGNGRTWSHFARYLPDREIYAFDRAVNSYPDCTPPGDHILLGELADTLPAAARRFAGQVALAHSDMGSHSKEHNAQMSALVSRELGPALADGALILSDLPLELPGASPLPLPSGAREDRYYLYRFRRG